jgi:CHAT domain-containing protein
VWSEANGAGILHLAVHGEYDPDAPLFSTLFLTDDDMQDGNLEAHEIYGLDLTAQTNLVVLSACQTQVGTVSRGDEVTSLSRAFIYAGSPAVVASLWNVDDEATAYLMERFHTHLKEGKGNGEALREAQIETRAKYPAPYHWAAFVLTGDVGEVQTNGIKKWLAVNWLALAAVCFGTGLVVVLGVMGFTVWRRTRSRVRYVVM